MKELEDKNEDSGFENDWADTISDSTSTSSLDDSCQKRCLFSEENSEESLPHKCMISNYNLSGKCIETVSGRTLLYLGGCVRELNISNNKLQILPDLINQLQNLEILNVSRNLLSSLPSSLKQLHKLKGLNLSNNLFREMPECLIGIEQLTDINLSHNKLKICVKPLSCLSVLQCLDLSHNELDFMPMWIFDDKCRSLKNLNMSFNSCLKNENLLLQLINYTHHRISAFKTVKILNLSNIRIRQLRRLELIRLLNSFERIESLYLGNVHTTLRTNHEELEIFNILDELPMTIFQNPDNIVELHLQNAGLTGLPEDFSKLKNLKLLYLSENLLFWLPESFGELTLLETLSLSFCDLVNLPKNFHQLSNLRNLTLNNNKLSNVHQLDSLFNLECLDLYDNCLEEFPLSKDLFHKVKQLDVACNYFDVQEVLEENLQTLYEKKQKSLRDEFIPYSSRCNATKTLILSSYSSSGTMVF